MEGAGEGGGGVIPYISYIGARWLCVTPSGRVFFVLKTGITIQNRSNLKSKPFNRLCPESGK